MELLGKEKTLKVMSVTRYHFIAGLPCAGAELLTDLLAQNQRVCATTHSAAANVMAELEAQFQNTASAFSTLDGGCRTAMMRAGLDAVHHARPLDAAIFDNNPAWMAQTFALSKLFPLSRFIFMVRDPAAIVETLGADSAKAEALMGDDGAIGAPLRLLSQILAGPNADRVLLIDYDRLMADPEGVMGLLYRFLRLPGYAHDMSILGARAAPVPKRRTIALGRPVGYLGRVRHRRPVWFRMRASEATMVLAGV